MTNQTETYDWDKPYIPPNPPAGGFVEGTENRMDFLQKQITDLQRQIDELKQKL